MNLVDKIKENAKNNLQRIVLPESYEERTLQAADELLAEGNGGTRQMYNYAAVNNSSSITTPKDDWAPDKVGETAMKDMESERNKDLQIQHVDKQGGMMR